VPIDPLSPGGLSPLSRAPVPVAASPTNAVAIRVAVGAGPTQALIALVDVDSQGSGGLLAVRVNGREQLATASPDFRVGGRYLAEVRTPQTGGPVELRTLAPGEDQSDLLTKALLRSAGAASPYPESLDRIATALASGDHDATSDVVRRAADTAKAAIDKSRAGREGPPTGEGLRAFVRDGGLQYEAKLKTLTEAGGPVAQNHPELAGDVKGAILGLLRAVSTTGADPAATSLGDAESVSGTAIVASANGSDSSCNSMIAGSAASSTKACSIDQSSSAAKSVSGASAGSGSRAAIAATAAGSGKSSR
jgi:plasmid stabilization system protein ParE